MKYGYCPVCKREVGLDDGLLEEHRTYLVLGSKPEQCPGTDQPPEKPPPEDMNE